MHYKFLNKVVGLIVYETKIEHEKERIYFPFMPRYPKYSIHLYSDPFFPFRSDDINDSGPFSFRKHCRNVYGLNDYEIKYVWEQYKIIIRDKVKNG